MKKKYKSGDLFLLPIDSGNVAVCQVVCAFKDRFKKVFSFGVIQIMDEGGNFDFLDGEYFNFNNSRGVEEIIFTSPEKLQDGGWKIIGNLPLTPKKNELKYFRNAYNLYYGDDFLENLDKSRAKEFRVMGIAGFELVQNYLLQMVNNK